MKKTMAERVKTNYDHPQALETDLLIQHLEELLKGNSVEMPQYDFTHHTRQKECTIEKPSPLILIEGILLFENEQLRDLCDLKAYIDVPADIRILRRIKRDILERGRTIEMCTDQYLAFTRPMHEQFVEPTKGFADIIIPNSGNSDKGVQTIIDTLEKKLQIT
jgi:uridine kinase